MPAYLMLATRVLHRHGDTGRFVSESDGGLRFVDVLQREKVDQPSGDLKQSQVHAYIPVLRHHDFA